MIRPHWLISMRNCDALARPYPTVTELVPFLAFNTLESETERSEHSGLMNLMKGMSGAFRNVAAHAAGVVTYHGAGRTRLAYYRNGLESPS